MRHIDFNSELRHDIEAVLSAKLNALLESLKLLEAATILQEADPKPQLWKDHEGSPVIPKPEEWNIYFQALNASHIKAQLSAAHNRWEEVQTKAKAAAKKAEMEKSEATVLAAKVAAAQLKTLGMEISVAERTLKSKEVAGKKFTKKQTDKRNARVKSIHDMVVNTAHGVSHGSPLVGHIVSHIAKAVADHLTKPST